MQKKRVLTGITTTGTPHLGNYVGAIRPAIAASRRADVESFYFLADYHALVKCDDPARVQQSTLEIAASWLACGLDPDKVFFYRQSDIPEIPELTWLLTCVTAKGLLNRAHAYKAAVDQNTRQQRGCRRRHHRGSLHVSRADGRRHSAVQRARGAGRSRSGAAHRDRARHRAAFQPHLRRRLLRAARSEHRGKRRDACPAPTAARCRRATTTRFRYGFRRTISRRRSSASSPIRARRASRRIRTRRTSSRSTRRSRAPTKPQRCAARSPTASPGAKRSRSCSSASTPSSRRSARATTRLIARPADIEEQLHAGAQKARERSRAFIERLRWAVGVRRLTDRGSSVDAKKSADDHRRVAADEELSRSGRQVLFQARIGRRRDAAAESRASARRRTPAVSRPRSSTRATMPPHSARCSSMPCPPTPRPTLRPSQLRSAGSRPTSSRASRPGSDAAPVRRRAAYA